MLFGFPFFIIFSLINFASFFPLHTNRSLAFFQLLSAVRRPTWHCYKWRPVIEFYSQMNLPGHTSTAGPLRPLMAAGTRLLHNSECSQHPSMWQRKENNGQPRGLFQRRAKTRGFVPIETKKPHERHKTSVRLKAVSFIRCVCRVIYSWNCLLKNIFEVHVVPHNV